MFGFFLFVYFKSKVYLWKVKIHLHCLGGSSSFSLCLLYSSPWLKARCSTKQRYSWCAFCFLLKLKVFYAFYLDIPSNLAVFRQPFPHSVIFWSMRGNKQHPSLSPPCPTTSPATAHRVLNDALCNWAVSRCHGKFLLCHHFGGACGNSSAEKEFTFYLNICLLLWCK